MNNSEGNQNKDEGTSSDLGWSAATVSLGTFLSRIFGLIRDMSIAFVFGASRVTDVFFLSYQIPSLFRKLLAEGALSSAVVPVYVDIKKKDEPSANRLANAVFTWTYLGVGGLVVLGIIIAPLLVSAVAPGFIGTRWFDLTVTLTRYMFPFLLFMSSAAVVMGILHGKKYYAPSAFAPVCFNIALIVSVLFLAPMLGSDPLTQVYALVVGVLVGGFLQFLVQWLSLSAIGITLGWDPDWSHEGLRRILSMMGPMIAGLAVTQMIVFIDKIVASFLSAGNISHLYYSNRLFQFPFALIGIALGTVVLPESSEHVSSEDFSKVIRTTRESLGMMSFLMIPATCGLWLIGYPLIGLLFRTKEFTLADQAITFGVLTFALFGLLAYGFIRIFVSVCYSFEDTRGPLIGATLALCINAVLDVVLVAVWPGNPNFRVCALTLAGSLAVWVQVMYLRSRLNIHMPEVSIVPTRPIVRHLALSVPMVLILWPIVRSTYSDFLKVLVGTTLGALTYIVGAYFAGDPYPTQFKDELTERMTGE